MLRTICKYYSLGVDARYLMMDEGYILVTKSKIEDETFQALRCPYYYSLEEFDDTLNKDLGDPLQIKVDGLIPVISSSLLSFRHYIESAESRVKMPSWVEAGKLLMRPYRIHDYSMHSLVPTTMVAKAKSYLDEIAKEPYAKALTEIEGEERRNEVNDAVREYLDISTQILQNKQDKPQITGMAASDKTFECFEKIFLYTQAMTFNPKDDKFVKLYNSLNSLIEKYNAKARANETRNANAKDKDSDQDIPVEPDPINDTSPENTDTTNPTE